MAEKYEIVWIIIRLKLLCAGVDSHINKFYSEFHTLKAFCMIHQQSGATVRKYFDRFKSAQVNAELSKVNVTKNE